MNSSAVILDNNNNNHTTTDNNPPYPSDSVLSSESIYVSLIRLSDILFRSIAATGKVSAVQLATLHFLFPKFLQGLDLYESKAVRQINCSLTQRFVFHVLSESAKYHNSYWDNTSTHISAANEGNLTEYNGLSGYLVSWHHCSCEYFHHSVLLQQATIYCKHQLAARLAHALANNGNLITNTISQKEFDELLLKHKKPHSNSNRNSPLKSNNPIALSSSTATSSPPPMQKFSIPETPFTPALTAADISMQENPPVLNPLPTPNFSRLAQPAAATPILQVRRN
jgi:predicted nucleic acid-binding Zn finger protein